MDVKTKLQASREERVWVLRCQQLEQVADILKHMAMNPETTEPETLVEVTRAALAIALGEAVTSAWLAGVLPRHVSSPLGWLAAQERSIKRRCWQKKRARRKPS